jgi:5S rRNA maturation endonuclease (ribonuclease M5)
MSQVNNYGETYRFLTDFLFKGLPIREYIQIEIEKVTNCKVAMDQIKKENPELAKAEDLRTDVVKETHGGVAKI